MQRSRCRGIQTSKKLCRTMSLSTLATSNFKAIQETIVKQVETLSLIQIDEMERARRSRTYPSRLTTYLGQAQLQIWRIISRKELKESSQWKSPKRVIQNLLAIPKKSQTLTKRGTIRCKHILLTFQRTISSRLWTTWWWRPSLRSPRRQARRAS